MHEPMSLSCAILPTHQRLVCATECLTKCFLSLHSDKPHGLGMQGDAQCCVTGAAVQHLLQLGDQPLLETVLRNTVVFSRMKSHQKGQIMDLLGCKGLQHVVSSQQQYIPVSTCCSCFSPVSMVTHSFVHDLCH